MADHKWIYKICLSDCEENAAVTLCVCVCKCSGCLHVAECSQPFVLGNNCLNLVLFPDISYYLRSVELGDSLMIFMIKNSACHLVR